MGSENSTDSVSFASDMARRIRAGFGLIGRAFVVAMERLTGRPLSRVTKKRLAMSATRRSTFVWEIVRDRKTAEPELPEHFVRVEADVPETAPVMEEAVEEFPEAPIVEKVYNTPASAMVSATSSGAMMYEFSGSHFDYDSFSEEAVEETEFESEVYEAPVFKEAVEDEDREFYENVYEDLTVDAVIAYMDTIELYAKPREETAEEKAYFEGLYEDLTVDAVLAYMDTIELYASVAEAEEEIQQEQVMTLAAPQPVAALAAPVSQISGYIEAPASYFAGYIEAPAVQEMTTEHVETEEEKAFYESVYEDLTVFAVLDYMDTIELYARPAPEYVISEIEMPEECETVVRIEPKFVPDYVISEIAMPEECETSIEIEQPKPVVKQSILAQFVFGFDAPVASKPGPTKVRFIVGNEEEPEDDTENVQVMSYSGNAAVTAQNVSNGPLAL